jgi:hypothetical protein
MIPLSCPRDGSPLRLDTEHLRRVASTNHPEAFPIMWRCVASAHTVMDREPDRVVTHHLDSYRNNGVKGGTVIRAKRVSRSGRGKGRIDACH